MISEKVLVHEDRQAPKPANDCLPKEGIPTLRLFEFEAKTLLRDYGIATTDFRLAQTAREAAAAAAALAGDRGEVVIKAQVLSGGRMKAGGIEFARGPEDVAAKAARLLSSPLLGVIPDRVLIEAKAPVARELFVAVTYDPPAKRPVLLASRHGGIDVENPSAPFIKHPVNPTAPLWPYECRRLASRLGLTGRDQQSVAGILHRLYRLFTETDATLAEINPLAQTADGRWLALDAHVDIDDDALYRQTELQSRFDLAHRSTGLRPPTPLEQQAAAVDAMDHRGVAGRVVEFEGEVALLIGGGGASLTVFDAVRAAGGRPANYCEVGGNPSVAKVAALTRLLLEKPGVRRIAVIMNIVNNTRADLMARGVIKGVIQAGRDPSEAIAVFRIPGAREEESAKILDYFGVPYCDRRVSIDEAALMAVRAGNRSDASSGGTGSRDERG